MCSSPPAVAKTGDASAEQDMNPRERKTRNNLVTRWAHHIPYVDIPALEWKHAVFAGNHETLPGRQVRLHSLPVRGTSTIVPAALILATSRFWEKSQRSGADSRKKIFPNLSLLDVVELIAADVSLHR
jgi:hypothetical protein